MKHNMIRTFAIALLATFTVPVLANKAKKADLKSITQPSVAFLGAEGENSLFAVQLENATPIKFVLSLTDAEGNNIYSQEFETASFSKVFKLVAENPGINANGLTFHFSVLTTGEKHDFEVKSATQLVKETAITKL
jgi:hypothetical protein